MVMLVERVATSFVPRSDKAPHHLAVNPAVHEHANGGEPSGRPDRV